MNDQNILAFGLGFALALALLLFVFRAVLLEVAVAPPLVVFGAVLLEVAVAGVAKACNSCLHANLAAIPLPNLTLGRGADLPLGEALGEALVWTFPGNADFGASCFSMLLDLLVFSASITSLFNLATSAVLRFLCDLERVKSVARSGSLAALPLDSGVKVPASSRTKFHPKSSREDPSKT